MQITTSYEYGNDEYTEENSVWESTDPTVATVVKGLVTPLKAGAATITLKVGAKPYVALTVTVAANEWIEIGTPEQFNSIHSEGSYLTGGAEVRNIITKITANPDVTFRDTGLFIGLACNGSDDVKLTNAFAITDLTLDIYCTKPGSGKVVQNNVHTYADKAALLAEQKVLMDSWDQAFWGFLNAEAVVEA